jgi:hypothetical protein
LNLTINKTSDGRDAKGRTQKRSFPAVRVPSALHLRELIRFPTLTQFLRWFCQHFSFRWPGSAVFPASGHGKYQLGQKARRINETVSAGGIDEARLDGIKQVPQSLNRACRLARGPQPLCTFIQLTPELSKPVYRLDPGSLSGSSALPRNSSNHS